MDLVQLRSFANVAERGTVAAAAAALGFTPPAVSQHVAKLEAELGIALFDRAGRRLSLTDAGQALLPMALEMIDLEATARRTATAPPERPHLAVGGFASAIASLLLPRLETLRRSMALEIVEGEDTDSLRELRLGRLDLALVQEYDAMPVERDPRLTFTPLLRDRLRLVVPSTMPVTTRARDLGAMPWLVNGHGTRCTEATHRVMRAAGITPTIAAVVADNDTLLALVAAGHGVTVVPELLLEVPPPGLVVTDEEVGISRTVLAVHRHSQTGTIAPLLSALRAGRGTTVGT